MKMISFINQIVLQNMDYHSTPVDFDEKCATIFVDRLTNLTITFLSPRGDKRAMHSSIFQNWKEVSLSFLTLAPPSGNLFLP